MLKHLSRYTFALIGLTILFGSCKKEYESIQSVDAQKIKDYIKANNITAVEDPDKTGFYYQIIPGIGTDTAKYKYTDSVLYNGVVKSLANGSTYLTTSSVANLGTLVGYTEKFTASLTIPAIRTVLTKMKRGDAVRIFLPSYLAFGKNGSGDIPSNENIDLVITTYADKNQTALDERLIQKFITDKGLTGMTRDGSGVYYSVSAAGTRPDSTTNFSTITTTYTGRLIDGTVFDSNTDVSFSLSPGSVIDGWTKTIPGKIGVGGKMRMLIPSALGYKTTGSGTISPNSILDFDIEITARKN